MIIPVIVIFLAFTNEWNGLLWKDIYLFFTSGISVAVYEHGLAVWITLIYSYSLLFIGMLLLIYRIINSPKIYRLQMLIIILAIVSPFIFNIIYLFGLSKNPVDLTPIAFVITGILAAIGIFKFKILDILPIAYKKLFKNMINGFLIFDKNNRLLEANNTARNKFKLNKNDYLGQSFNVIFSKWDEFNSFFNNVGTIKEEIVLNNPTQMGRSSKNTSLLQ